MATSVCRMAGHSQPCMRVGHGDNSAAITAAITLTMKCPRLRYVAHQLIHFHRPIQVDICCLMDVLPVLISAVPVP